MKKRMEIVDEVKRIGQIVRALRESGLAAIAVDAGLRAHLPFWNKMVGAKAPSERDFPKSIRFAMERAGGAFLKLGQLLSLRPDKCSIEIADELRQLQDKVEPFPSDQARAIVMKEMGTKLLTSFENEPMGSASVAQVHRAKLRKDGFVVVKVQRPEARQQFLQDLAIMKRVAARLDGQKRFRQYGLPAIVEEFEKYTLRELDFNTEAAALAKAAKNFAKNPNVSVPKVIKSSRHVLVMTELRGIKLSQAEHYNREKIASTLVDAMLDMVFEHRFFHADLHPGNIMVMPGDRVGFLDFGITGTLTNELKKRGMEMYAALALNDPELALRALERSALDTKYDAAGLRADMVELFRIWEDKGHALPIQLFHLMFERASRRGVKLPADLVLVGKALVTLEATCRMIKPDFDISEHALKRLKNVRDAELRRAFTPSAIRHRLFGLKESLNSFSQDALDVMDRIKRGKITVDIEDTDIKHLGQDINTSSNRLSYALVVSALIVFAALVVNIGPQMGGVSSLTIGAITAAMVVLLALLISIWREGRGPFDEH